MRSAEPVGDAVSNFLTVGLRHDAHGCIAQFIAAVANDGRERGKFVWVDNDFTNVA